MDKVNTHQVPGNKKWGGPLKRAGNRIKTNKRKDFCRQHVADLRNSVPQQAVEADCIARLKKGPDKFMENRPTGSNGIRRVRGVSSESPKPMMLDAREGLTGWLTCPARIPTL